MMQYREFGRLGWKVSEIGIGTYAMGGHWGNIDDKESIEVLELAIELGVNFVDTADVYGKGRSETLISKIITNLSLRESIYIATKGGRDFHSDPPNITRNFSSSYLNDALNRSLERLKTDYVDLYQLHGPSVSDFQSGDLYQFLTEAKADGRIRAAGISLNNISELDAALNSTVIDAVQFIFNALDQSATDRALKACADHRIAIIAREPLAQGLLTGKYSMSAQFPPSDHRQKKWTTEFLAARESSITKFNEFSNQNRTLPQTAVGFVLAQPEITTVIPGARNRSQLRDNLGTLNAIALTNNEVRLINGLRIV